MVNLKALLERIAIRVNINLRDLDFDVSPYLTDLYPWEKFKTFSALCGLSPDHSLHYRFKGSCLSGSYFLDHCVVESSIIYKSDIRGDELKKKGDRFESDGISLLLTEDEEIHIKDSFFGQDPGPQLFP